MGGGICVGGGMKNITIAIVLFGDNWERKGALESSLECW